MTLMDLGFSMHAERTPNPNSIKWVLDRAIVEPGISAHFDVRPSEEISPLAAKLLAIEGIAVVFMASNFVTLTKRDDAEWTDLGQPIVAVLKECLAGGGGGGALGPAFEAQDAAGGDEVVARIRRVLDEEVRPAVAMDGGDVVFARFCDGVVELYLQGACSGCPGSAATLKHGIEARLREAIPEVQSVVAL
jgi:Fe-S cluster biogenesis protein NfuA